MEDLFCWQSKFESCYYSDRLINKIILLNESNNNKVDVNEIKKAIYYAKKYHGPQRRESGELFYSHPLEVAFMVVDHCCMTDTLVTSILHDILEDTHITANMLEKLFSPKIAEQVESLTRIKLDQKISVTEMITLLWSQKKEDLLLIKYFDRLHNLKTLQIKSTLKQRKIVLETLKEFLPLSAHLGLLDSENLISEVCTNININLKGLNAKETLTFSFVDDYQPLLLVFQNARY